MRRVLLLTFAVCLPPWCADSTSQAWAEEIVAKPRPVCSLFSPDLPLMPTNAHEMLPVHMRNGAVRSQPAPPVAQSNNAPVLVTSFGTGYLEGEMNSDIDQVRMEQLYRKLERGGYLAPREQKSDNGFVRAMDAVFTPEVIEIGGAAIAFSPYTAIKRKNPFCLLNPVPIVISW